VITDNTLGVIKGISVVTCVYVNPETDQFWIKNLILFIESLGKVIIAHSKITAELMVLAEKHFIRV